MQPHRAHQRDMHRPGRVTHPHGGIRGGGMQHLGTQPHRAASARGLYRRRAITEVRHPGFTEYQRADPIQIIGISLGRHIHLGLLLADQRLLRLLNRFKYGAQAGFIHVNAQRQIHLVGVGVSATGGGQTEN